MLVDDADVSIFDHLPLNLPSKKQPVAQTQSAPWSFSHPCATHVSSHTARVRSGHQTARAEVGARQPLPPLPSRSPALTARAPIPSPGSEVVAKTLAGARWAALKNISQESSFNRAHDVRNGDQFACDIHAETTSVSQPLKVKRGRRTKRSSSRNGVLGAPAGATHGVINSLGFAGASELGEEVVKAAATFDKRHQMLSDCAAAVFMEVRDDLTSERLMTALSDLTCDVSRNRFFVPERYDPFFKEDEGPKVSYSKRRKWELEDSAWAPRRYGNGRDEWKSSGGKGNSPGVTPTTRLFAEIICI